ncbi:MAG TPA: chemotaxis protein CheX [Spirochaetes bacterium]|nr:chemotaxis protein CheX [Spirochaetota bacterium]
MSEQGNYVKLESEYLDNELINTCQKTLESTLSTSIEALGMDEPSSFSTCASVEYSGDFSGSLYISLDRKCAHDIAQILWGKEIPTVDTRITESVKELSNIIGGNIASLLEKQNLNISLDHSWKLSNFDKDKITAKLIKCYKYKLNGEIIQIAFLVK